MGYNKYNNDKANNWSAKTGEEPINYDHWKDRASLFNQISCKGKVVFLGNSITEFSEWAELTGRADVVDRGISGDFTHGVAKRMDTYLQEQPKAVFLMIGINDIGKGVNIDTIKANYKKILDKAKTSAIPFYVQSVLYVGNGGSYEASRTNPVVGTLNKWLQSECESRGLKYVDITSALCPGNTLADEFTNDKLHLNGAAYVKWISVISALLAQIPA